MGIKVNRQQQGTSDEETQGGEHNPVSQTCFVLLHSAYNEVLLLHRRSCDQAQQGSRSEKR